VTAAPIPRYLAALAGALLVTCLVFLFIQRLVENRVSQNLVQVVHEAVRILPPEPETPAPPTPEDSAAPTPEPALESLAVAVPTPPVPNVAETPQIAADPVPLGDIDLGPVGETWSAPLTGGDAVIAGLGQDARGFVEVVPFTTRRPNVPELAWRNHINGWVLVAFSVTPAGRTRDVRVLDADPRGVFEDKVVAAVRDWQYQVTFSGELRGDVVLTQKVEVRWENYPQNLPNVD